MSSALRVIMFWATATLSPLTILGNLAVCIFVPGTRSMRTFTKVLIVNFAIADLSYGLLKLAELATLKVITEVQIIKKFCTASAYITFVCCAVSILTLTAIAGERYLAVVKPLKYFQRNQKSTKKVSSVIVATWFLTGLVMVPTIYTHPPANYIMESSASAEYSVFCPVRLAKRNIFSYVYISIILTIYVLIPNIIVVLSYTLVIRKLWAAGVEAGSVNNSHLLKYRRRLTKLLLVITAIFVVCWIAILVQDCLYFAGYDSEAAEVLTSILVQFKSATDPVLYTFHGEGFRQNLKKFLRIPRRNTHRLEGQQNHLSEMRVTATSHARCGVQA